jgi:hypothetical protein
LSDAVELACAEDRDGLLERVSASQDKTTELLGRLINELHAAGSLSNGAVLRIIGPRFEE